MTTIIVSIGRNTGSDKLRGDHWYRFCERVEGAVERVSDEVVFAGTGRGQYQGQYEESFTVIGSVSWIADLDIVILRDKLRELAHTYRQDSIALTITEDTVFVEAAP